MEKRTAELPQFDAFLQQEIRFSEASRRARKQAEDYIQFQANVLSQVNDAVVAIDNERRITYLNKKAEQLFNVKADEVLGRTLQKAYQYRWLKLQDQQAACDSLATTGSWQGENIFIKESGEEIYVESSVSVLKDDSGTAIGFLAVIRDTTDRKQAEQKLRESQEQLQAILDYSTAVVYVKDTQGRYMLVNCQYETLLHVTREQVKGKTDYDLFAREVADAFCANDQKVLTAGTPLEFEEVFPLNDGLHTYLAIKFPLYDSAGVPYAICSISTDITDRKRAEQKIREQAALLNVATDAIFVRDQSQQIVFWNKGAECLYGWKAQEALALNANELLYKETTPKLEQAEKTAIETGEWQGELHQVTKEGKEIIVNSRWTLVRDEQGKPKSILTVNTDITEKKQLEAQFLRAQRLESIGTLASGIAHDLNNILAPILMTAQLLQMKIPDSRKERLLTTIESNAKRGAALVKQVLSFTRGVEGERTILQVRHLILEIDHIVKETFPKSIEFYTDIAPTLWTVSGDATQLHQVFMNLVVNARDAMPDGGTLSISAENLFIDENYARMNLDASVGPYIVITIADSGTGISPKIVDRIFEPFFTTKELGRGTGLGLATVMGIIKSHGGFVNVESSVGEGTEFKVFLPALEGTQTQQTEDIELPKGNGELILVADDEFAIREITKTSLITYNYKVITASDGIEAIALYAQHQDEINLVLVDMMMPEMDGATTIRTLQKINPKVKIIATSGLVSNDKIAEAAGNGVKAFLSKPCTAKELLNTINAVISVK